MIHARWGDSGAFGFNCNAQDFNVKWLKILLAVAALLLLAFGVFVWATRPDAGPGKVVVPAKTPFTKGSYFAFAQPWGGEMVTVLKPWSPHADSFVVDLDRFPANTTFHWRWPPVSAGFGPGVWGYDAVMYGNYDGGEPERPLPQIRMRDLRELRQRFAWTMENRFGDGNVLTEFYLRSSTTDVNAKVIEVGWFLHMPASTRAFFERSAPVGVFVDAQKRRWMVRMAEKFCMFAPEKSEDLRSGTLDMLPALEWLRQKGKISGDEWMSGLAIGVEPVRGLGSLSVDQWSVTMR
ncbi:hypothetical protein [Sphingomonas sp. CCH5-D11]|uniref:hypothetical protein n=1 Tax=Sphingomonas sp. CCH5-D11 TaxID=1768786 RepID=UPI0008375D12|nr:hypothetical protein [Sphingomonas sp. CCH5-D11]